jgi:hypothetical protein
MSCRVDGIAEGLRHRRLLGTIADCLEVGGTVEAEPSEQFLVGHWNYASQAVSHTSGSASIRLNVDGRLWQNLKSPCESSKMRQPIRLLVCAVSGILLLILPPFGILSLLGAFFVCMGIIILFEDYIYPLIWGKEITPGKTHRVKYLDYDP